MAQEICNNNTDDDADGSIDCGDSACAAHPSCAISDPNMGPLVAGAAGYFFERPDNKGVLLVGSHTWGNGGQLWDSADPPSAWDWISYADDLKNLSHNTMRLWMWEQSYRSWQCTTETWWTDALPWSRSVTAGANDGKNKFDLSVLNQVYFDNLRDKVIKLANREMYATVVLFNGWSGVNLNSAAGEDWHPFHPTNNINSIDPDASGNGGDNDGNYEEVHENSSYTAMFDIQKAYVEKVIDTLNDLPNVIYEISNESPSGSIIDGSPSTGWHADIINHINTYQGGKANQHPVCASKEAGGGDTELYNLANTDCVMPGFGGSPGEANGGVVSIADSDHICGTCDVSMDETQRRVVSGHNIFYMDQYDCFHGECFDALYTGSCSTDLRKPTRVNTGIAGAYSGRVDFGNMAPTNSLRLDAAEYSLADTGGSSDDILTYVNGLGSVRLDLSSGNGESWSVEWQDVNTRKITRLPDVVGTSDVTFSNPFGAVDAYLLVTQDPTSLAPSDGIQFGGIHFTP